MPLSNLYSAANTNDAYGIDPSMMKDAYAQGRSSGDMSNFNNMMLKAGVSESGASNLLANFGYDPQAELASMKANGAVFAPAGTSGENTGWNVNAIPGGTTPGYGQPGYLGTGSYSSFGSAPQSGLQGITSNPNGSATATFGGGGSQTVSGLPNPSQTLGNTYGAPPLQNANGVVSNPPSGNIIKTDGSQGFGLGAGNPGPGYVNTGTGLPNPYGPPAPAGTNSIGQTAKTGLNQLFNTISPTGPTQIDPNVNPSVIQAKTGGPANVTPIRMASSPATDPTYPTGTIPAPAPVATGPSASDISNYWNSNQDNPGLLNSSMNQYGVSPEQVASATGLGLDDILNKISPPTSTDAGYSWNPNDPIFSNGNLYTPIYGPDAYSNGITQATKPTGYTKYKFDPAANDNQTLYNGQPYTTIDDTGKQTGSGKLSGFSNQSFMDEFGPFLMVGAGFTAALAAGAGAAAAAGAGADAGGGAAATVGGGATAGSTIPTSFGVVDDSVASLGAGGGAGGGGLVGDGLNVAPGSGLNLASTSGGLGLTAPGAGATTGLGLNASVAGGALTSGAGLSGGLANGSGTLLGPTITDGGYTMANGTIVPGAGTNGGNLTAPPAGGAPPPSGGAKPPVPGVAPPGGTNGGNPTSGTGSFGLSDILKLIGGAYDSSQQSKASTDMLNYLKSQQSKIDNLYAPGSPEANYLWDAMSRKDAAAGRNSQYGPRSVDLASRIAQIKADDTAKMTTGIGGLYAAALNKGASSDASILAALGSLGGSGGGSLSDIAKWLQNLYTPNAPPGSFTPDTTTPDNSQNFQPDGGDLGQYF